MMIFFLLVKVFVDCEICNVMFELVGWQYVGFCVLCLKVGDIEMFDIGVCELCVVVFMGMVCVDVDGVIYDVFGKCDSVFEDVLLDVLYVLGGKIVMLVVMCDVEVVLCIVLYVSGDKLVWCFDGEWMCCLVCGQGINMCYVCDILMGDNLVVDWLLVVEVVMLVSYLSSYLLYKYDCDVVFDEILFEEIYYYWIDLLQGFVFQCVYIDDCSFDEVCVVENYDVVMVLCGYYLVVVFYGYNLYYLNVMVGFSCVWVFKNDFVYEWMFDVMLKC